MTEIIILVGMPGSGKTFHIQNYYKDYVAYDDIMFFDKSKLNRNDKKVVFATPYFCNKNILEEFVLNIEVFYNSKNIKVMYFENNYDKCLKNIKKRNDGRACFGFLNRLSKTYEPPKYAIEIHD